MHDHHGPEHHHGPVAHEASADWKEAYDAAYTAAQPDPSRQVIPIELETGEFDWEFVQGKTTRAWGFNQGVPGPTIEARVGDVLQIRLKNRLPEPTAVHWHGLRLPAAMDGTEMVQRPIPPEGLFMYRFKLLDAGTFWYHPHVNETVQLERGLYGTIIVRGPEEPRLDAERVFVLDDVELERDGQVKPPGGWMEQHMGRQGGIRLVNGHKEPEITVAAGQIERWRIVNASSARSVRISIGGAPFRILGTGGGLIERPVTKSEWLLVAANRVDIAVGPFEEGQTLRLQSLSKEGGKRGDLYATVRVGPARPSQASIPDVLRRIEPLAPGPAVPSREIHFGWKPGMKHGGHFLVNQEAHHRDKPVCVGELQIWDVINDTMMDHPFHLHGFFFQVVEVNGEKPEFLSWEDTMNIPPKGRVRIAWMPDDRPGEWMYHCHILEHHAAGMMAHFEIVR
jgi:FtsP/CotA-like multicopper oxidase with cupredoxin domain